MSTAAEAAGALLEAAFPIAAGAAVIGTMALLADHIQTVNSEIAKQVAQNIDLAFSTVRGGTRRPGALRESYSRRRAGDR
jgi:hypothetical protein